jgi:hypothetical protein
MIQEHRHALIHVYVLESLQLPYFYFNFAEECVYSNKQSIFNIMQRKGEAIKRRQSFSEQHRLIGYVKKINLRFRNRSIIKK